jgi:hypothetical protein
LLYILASFFFILQNSLALKIVTESFSETLAFTDLSTWCHIADDLGPPVHRVSLL